MKSISRHYNSMSADMYNSIMCAVQQESKRYEYKPDVDQNIVVVDEDGIEYARISMDRFMNESALLLEEIKNAKESAFEIPASETFMNRIGCTKLKAPSKDKADIHIVIHDLRTNMTPLLGFSIKSQLGSASTLLNAGVPTNILYCVHGVKLTDTQINEINSIDGHISRMSELYNVGCKLQYADIEYISI